MVYEVYCIKCKKKYDKDFLGYCPYCEEEEIKEEQIKGDKLKC